MHHITTTSAAPRGGLPHPTTHRSRAHRALWRTLTAPLLGLGVAACGQDTGLLAPGLTQGSEEAPLSGVCKQVTVGQLGQCQSIEVLRALGAAQCASEGLEVGPVGYAKACDGGWQLAQATCCGLPPAAASPEAPTCSTRLETSPVCQSEDDLRAIAQVRCGGAHRVADVAFGGSCSAGWKFAKYTCCDAEPVGLPDPVAEAAADGPCAVARVTLSANGAPVCADVESLRREAGTVCEAAGRKLTDVRALGACAEGGFASVAATCCDLPPPEAPASACAAGLLGGPEACQPESVWRKQASAACGAQGLVPSSVEAFEACGIGATRYARISCCPAIAPEDRCIATSLGGGTYCAPASVWAAGAKATCAESGRAVDSLGVEESCGPGMWRRARVACCAETLAEPVVPPPSHGPVCTESTLLAPKCRSARDWSSVARDLCGVRQAQVDDMSLADGCHGGYLSASVRCCGANAVGQCQRRRVTLQGLCVGRSDAEKMAAQACADDGLRFKGLTQHVACDAKGDGTSLAFSCCP